MPNTTNLFGTTVSSEFDDTKVATYNALAQILDDAIAGKLDVSTTGGTTTLTGTPAAPQAQKMFLNVSGTLASNATIEIPVAVGTGRNRIYVVKNGTTGAFTLTVKKVGGTGVTVGQGNTAFLLYNGTDIAYAAPQIVSATGALAPVSQASIWARAFHSTTQSITTATVTALSLDSEHYDTDTIHDLVTNNSRLTCKTAGIYDMLGLVGFATNATGWRAGMIRLNGTTYLGSDRRMNTGAVDAVYLQVKSRWPLAVNDYIELMVEQTSGGALSTVRTANISSEFMMQRTGA